MSKYLFKFPPLLKATFLKRPQRFLAEMQLDNGGHITSYCANPGSLSGCLIANSKVLIWDSNDPKRKRRYTWRAIKIGKTWVGTDTHLSNKIVLTGLQQGLIPTLDCYDNILCEHLITKGHRVDFFLTGEIGTCYLEVKSVSVVKNSIAQYPDSITPRGLKHINGLINKVKAGNRAVLLFLIQRGDAKGFRINNAIYPEYADAIEEAVSKGIEILAISVEINAKGYFGLQLLPIIK